MIHVRSARRRRLHEGDLGPHLVDLPHIQALVLLDAGVHLRAANARRLLIDRYKLENSAILILSYFINIFLEISLIHVFNHSMHLACYRNHSQD